LDDPSSLSGNIVTRLLIDHAHTMWVATTDGLNRFDPGAGHFDVYKAKGQDRSPFYLDLAEDPQGRLWLGSLESGLQRFDSATGEFKIYKHDSDDVGSLSNNRVNSVHIDRSGAMWIGTQNGLDKFDPTTETFTTFYERDGLGGNVVGCVLEDGHGKLWMSTNKGISRFDPAKGTFQNYSDSDGLPGADLTGWGACHKSPSGEMLFGGFSGATAFFPDEIADSAASPSVVLTDFRLTGAHVDVGAGSPLQQSITFLPALTLSHRQNIFSLEFSTLSYLSPATNRYRYRLQGLNDDWIYTDSDHRYASYTTLPPGVYEFRVQAATSRGSWSEPGAALRIEILPPWWSTWWFRALYGVAILLIAVAAYRYRMVRMARQFNARMEERVDERTRIAQDLHDTLLQGLLSASMQLHVADDQMPPNSPAKPLVGRVLALMKQVIDEGRNAVRGLRSATAEARSLEEAFSKVPQAMGMQGDIDLRVIVEGQPQALHAVVRDEVHRIGREALVNAFRHSHANRIEVELEYATQSLRMCVRDDGVGIKAEMLRSGREGHWGLEGMRERAERIGAKLRVWSHASAGTEVELTVPGSIAFESSSIEGASMWIGRRRGRNMQSDLTKQEKAS
jgi:signal transduction histidine kinase